MISRANNSGIVSETNIHELFLYRRVSHDAEIFRFDSVDIDFASGSVLGDRLVPRLKIQGLAFESRNVFSFFLKIEPPGDWDKQG